MTRIPRDHPRYQSLRVRARLAEEMGTGLLVPEGLIAHGRGEAFDYFLGERTTPSAQRAIRHAATWLANARHPVISVNGNVATLAAGPVARLVRRLPALRVEANLFHRSEERVALVRDRLIATGVGTVLGLRPTVPVPGLTSDRGRADAEGIAVADVCLIPLEDGDRTEALRLWGKRVVSIDLNPLSRTSQEADLPIVDELLRALAGLDRALPGAIAHAREGHFPSFDRQAALDGALETMARNLRRRTPARSVSPPAPDRASPRRLPGTAGRSRRTR